MTGRPDTELEPEDLRAEVERLRLRLAGEQLTAELGSTPALDVDQQLRVAALQAAAQAWAGMSAIRDRDGAMVATAHVFEAYLRGDE